MLHLDLNSKLALGGSECQIWRRFDHLLLSKGSVVRNMRWSKQFRTQNPPRCGIWGVTICLLTTKLSRTVPRGARRGLCRPARTPAQVPTYQAPLPRRASPSAHSRPPHGLWLGRPVLCLAQPGAVIGVGRREIRSITRAPHFSGSACADPRTGGTRSPTPLVVWVPHHYSVMDLTPSGSPAG